MQRKERAKNKYGVKCEFVMPWIPEAGTCAFEDNEGPSIFAKRVQDTMEYPPLFADKSWTKSVPHTDTQQFYKPSETIGSAFTPGARNLRIQDLPPRRKKPPPNPLGADGKLQYPAKKMKHEEEADKKKKDAALKKRQKKNDCYAGLVDIEDLLTREYWRKKEAQKMKREQIKEMKLKLQIMEWELPDLWLQEKEDLKKRQAVLPLHPDRQKKHLIKQAEKEMMARVRKKDVDRIQYYLTKGIDKKIISLYPQDLLKKAMTTLPPKYKRLKAYRSMIATHKDEILEQYDKYMRENLVKYVLKDPDEWERLRIATFPFEYPIMLVRAPVPWHNEYMIGTQLLEKHYYLGNIIVRKVTQLWFEKYDNMLILPVSRFEEIGTYPLDLNLLEEHIDNLCKEARNILEKEWLSLCADVFLEYKKHWKQYIPLVPRDNVEQIQHFFNCVNGLLSMQLRSLVMRSMYHLLDLMIKYKGGNNYGDQYYDLALINMPIIKITVEPVIGTEELKLNPTLEEVEDFIQRIFQKILDVNEYLPRLENIMFPEFVHNETYLFPVRQIEEPIMKIFIKAKSCFIPNLIGPYKYLEMYQKFYYILNGEAETSLNNFFELEPFPYLKDFSRRIYRYEEIQQEIILLRRSIPLNFISLECGKLNDTLYNILDDLRMRIVNYFADETRVHNRSICDTFDDMSSNVSESPDTVAELVALMNYVVECRDVTMYNLRDKIRKTAENVAFLMDHAHLSPDDINLNCRVFLWPKDMENVIELAIQRLNMKREQAEAALKNKRALFDTKLIKHEKILNQFKKKDPPLLTMDEMEEAVIAVEDIMQKLQQDKAEADQINEEEQLMDFDPSPFMNLYKMLATVDPYDKLWHTVLDFHEKYDDWYYGSFADLDADEVNEYVENCWKTLYKLSKTLNDNPGAKRIADMVRSKVEKFRQFMPVLQTICNKGLQKRHWDMISEIVGVELIITEDSTLNDMIEAGLPKFSAQLEEISGAATKEHTLEKNLRKMKEEWFDVFFECIPYRETGVHILTAVDDIQVMMDDHILKAQTMRGSPYVKAFEAEMQGWEEKLISMQDILEEWLQCQSTWMYLEPIFSSEDIMRQMPTEARNFKIVDRVWRAIQANTILDTHVLAATDYKNMLSLLRENNRLLDDIQKGLNDYLEKKRLFFPRFFFLSNDELLEILSETKDPLRVQPHLKKCFEGIHLLDFNEDEEVISMISAEKEHVPLSTKVIPADAKGMVEKWLVQVEAVMIQSMKDITAQSLYSYENMERDEWIISCPGQIVQCCNCVLWTSDVTNAIKKGTLPDQVERCTEQIEDSVKMVQGKLLPGNQITVEALIVIDVHGIY